MDTRRPAAVAVAIGAIGAGVALRTWGYAANLGLWLDEILLTNGIRGVPLASLLTEPLPYDQVAPRGFLLLERLAIALGGPSEAMLRLVPWLAASLSLYLFWRLAQRLLPPWEATLAVGLFAVATPLINFAAMVKQYASDVAVAIALVTLCLQLRQQPVSTGRLLIAGVGGLVAAAFSQAAVPIMAGMGLALAVDWVLTRDARALRVLVTTIPLWAIASAMAVLAGLRAMTPSTRGYMDRFWADGYLPDGAGWTGVPVWVWGRLASMLADPGMLAYPWPAAMLGVVILGMAVLWTRSRTSTLLLGGPFVVCMAAAMAGHYPFRGRLVATLLPALLIALAVGMSWLARQAAVLHPLAGAVTLAVLLASPLLAIPRALPPQDTEHFRALLDHLRRQRQPGDAVYVFPLQRIGTAYYGDEYGLRAGDWESGACSPGDARTTLRDLDRFRGSPRVWVLSAGARPFVVNQQRAHAYLDVIGHRRDRLTLPSRVMGTVDLVLWDLSDVTRLGQASAETFEVPPAPPSARPCRDWQQPDFASAPLQPR